MTISDLNLYLENQGVWAGSEFGYYVNSAFTPDVEAGGSQLANHFTVSPDATSGSPYAVPVGLSDTTSDYVWLDVDIPSSATGPNDSVNYRFTYNFT
jgi:hypothetical protein